MIEYLQRCGFDLTTWPLLFAVIMDIRLGHVDHRGCVPHTQVLRSLDISGGLGPVISTVCTRFLGRRPWRWTRFLWKYLVRKDGLPRLWRCLLCPGPFFRAASITKKAKNSGTESLLCAAVCFMRRINPLHAICSFVLSE